MKNRSSKIDALELTSSDEDNSRKPQKEKKTTKNKKTKEVEHKKSKDTQKKSSKIQEQEIESDTEYNDREYSDGEIEKANQRIAKVVKEWIDCDDQIREYNKVVKILKQHKQAYEKKIIKTMKEYDVENTITLKDGKLIKNESRTKVALKQDFLESTLTELVKSKEKAQEITQYILDKRPIKVREYLKRTRVRKGKDKK